MSSTPSPVSGRALGVLATQVLAAVVLLVAWDGASGEVSVADQWAWGALSVAALAASGVANAAVLVGLRRRLARAAEEL